MRADTPRATTSAEIGQQRDTSPGLQLLLRLLVDREPDAELPSGESAGESTADRPPHLAPAHLLPARLHDPSAVAPAFRRIAPAMRGMDPREAARRAEIDLLRPALAARSLRIVIATVPDPIDSHLDWMYDIDVAAMRTALETEEYVADAFWLPWSARDSTRHPAGTSLRAELTRERFPGVMLFRRNGDSDLVLLYLVGELPTTGVRKAALRVALRERSSLLRLTTPNGPRPPIAILGPTFSGSAPSLAVVLGEAGETSSDEVRLISGTASQPSAAEALKKIPGATYRTTIHSDVALDLVRDSLRKVLGAPGTDQLAILSEGSTAYGLGIASDTSAVIIRFPLNIATLRTAYQRLSATPSSTANPSTPQPTTPKLPLPLQDPATPIDRPTPMSALTDPTLDQAMEEIAQTLRLRDTRIVELTATDVRDVLFLAQQLRHRIPDIQLLTYERHALYERPDRSADLRGMLILSTYPPGARYQHIRTAHANHRRRLEFPTDEAEGTYNAMLMQLGDSTQLVDYSSPFDSARGPANATPPVWLSVVGVDAIVPLAVYRPLVSPDHVTHVRTGSGLSAAGDSIALYVDSLMLSAPIPALPPAPTHATRRPPPASTANQAGFVTPFDPLPGYLAVVLALALIAFAWSDRRAWVPEVGPRKKGRGTPNSRPQTEFTASGLGTVVALAAAFLAAAVGVHASDLTTGFTTSAVHVFVDVVVCVGIPVLLVGYSISMVSGTRPRDAATRKASPASLAIRAVTRDPGSAVGRIVAPLALAAFVWYLIDVFVAIRASDSSSLLLAYRYVVVERGVSAMVPFVLIALAFGNWALWHRARLRHVSSVLPLEQWFRSRRVASHHVAASHLRQARKFARRLRATMKHSTPTTSALILYLVIGVITLLYAALMRRQPIELLSAGLATPVAAWGFSLLFMLGALAGMAAPIWINCRLWMAWSNLQATLQSVSRTPIISAFERLPTFASRVTQIAVFGERYQSRSQALQAAAALQRRHIARLALKIPAAANLFATQSRVGDFEDIHSIISALWWAEPDQDVLSAAKGADKQIPAREPDGAYAIQASTTGQFRRSFPTTSRLLLRGAEEWYAVQVVRYVEWALYYIRITVATLLISSVLTALLFASYSFHPEAYMERVFFAELCAGTAFTIWLLVQINRNEMISAITNTTAGRVTWDRGFVVNIVVVCAVPLVTVLSTIFPFVRGFLFAWVGPLLGAIGKT